MLISSIKKNYKEINVTLLLISTYALTYPLWSFLLSKILPQFTKCVFLQITNRPCPFCGSTTYLKNFWLKGVSVETILDFKSVIVGFLILNVIFRCRSIIYKYNNINKIIVFDFISNLVLLILLIIHVLIFFINY
jgi:hypothetical protein